MSLFRPLIATLLAAVGSVALAAPMAYVPNEKSATLSVIDTATDRRSADIPAGQRPRGIAAGLGYVYLTDAKTGSLLIVDTSAGKLIKTVRVGDSPEGISLSADGQLLAIAVEDDNSVVLLSAPQGTELARIKVQGKNPEHAVFSPDGRWLYVSAEEAEQVDVVDVAARQQVSSIPVGKRPRGIGFLPDGSRAYVASEVTGKVFVIDVAQRRVIAEVKAGQYPAGIAVHPDGKRIRVQRPRPVGHGHRCGQQHGGRHHRSRQTSMEHGHYAGRRQALCGQWPFRQRFGD